LVPKGQDVVLDGAVCFLVITITDVVLIWVGLPMA
jgi:hypothetical protein